MMWSVCLAWLLVSHARGQVDRNGIQLPDGLDYPDVPQAFPPVRRDGGAGVIVLELIAPIADGTLCQVQRDNGDGGNPAMVEYFGSCASLVRVDGLQLDTPYQFWMRYLQTVTHVESGSTFEFEGPLSDPILLVSAAVPSWGEELPQIEALGATTIRIRWNEPATGGSTISGYVIYMERLDTGTEEPWVLYDGTGEWTVLSYIVQNLQIDARYRFSLYASNSLGRSSPSQVTYTVPRPHTPDTFFPLRWDPSELAVPLPSPVVADVTENVTIYARHPVTDVHEAVCRGGRCIPRVYLAALHDACELDVTRTVCIPVSAGHPRYEPQRQPSKGPTCCMISLDLGSELYTLNYTGRIAGYYSLMVQTLFPGGLVGQYWDNTRFEGNPFLVRLDPVISFDWEDGPITDLAGDMVSIRWTGFLRAPSTESYTIYLDSDDYARLWIQGLLMIDMWETDDGECCEQGLIEIDLVEGEYYMIQVDYIEIIGNATVELAWEASVTNYSREPIDSEYFFRGAVLADAPFDVEVRNGAAAPSASRILNPPGAVLASGREDRLWIEALDTAGNTVADLAMEFVAIFTGPFNTNLTFFSSDSRQAEREWITPPVVHEDYIHFIDYILPYPGNYTLEVFLRDRTTNDTAQELWQSPFHFEVFPDVLHPQMCVVYGSGAEMFTAGVETEFVLELRDAFGTMIKRPLHSIDVKVDIVWQEYIPPEWYVRDKHFVEAYSEWLSKDIEIVERADGRLGISYTAYRAGLNHLIVKVDGILIRGHREQVGGSRTETPSNPPDGGINEVIEIIGLSNPTADAVLSYIMPEVELSSCTTGIDCALTMQVRDSFGNRISEDRSSVLRFMTFPADCDSTTTTSTPADGLPYPEDYYNRLMEPDATCVPVDEGECVHIANGTHACSLLPTVAGELALRLLVNDTDTLSLGGSFLTESVSFGVDRTYFNVSRYTQGPWDINVFVGEVSANTTAMFGPGLDVTGNIVGTAQTVTVQFKDIYGNDHTSFPENFGTRYVPMRARLGATELDVSENGDGTATVQVYSELAGWFRLVVEIGFGCITDLLDDSFDGLDLECEDIDGSPSQLVYWAPSESTALGTTCELEYNMDAGSVYPFSCTPRDLYGNSQNDSGLWFNTSFRLYDEPESEISVFPAVFVPENGTYRVQPTIPVSGTYSVKVDMLRQGGVMAWYHRGLGFNSLIVTDIIGNSERQLEGDDSIVFTRLDPGLGDFEAEEDELTVLELREFFTVVWQGFVLPNASGEHTLHVNSSGSLRLELDGVSLMDNLPRPSQGEVAEPTIREIPVIMDTSRLMNVTILYSHGVGPLYMKLYLSRGGNFWHVPRPIVDSQWFYMRTVRYAYMPAASLPGDPAIALVSAIGTDVPTSIEDDISVMTVNVINRFTVQTRDVHGNARTTLPDVEFDLFLKGPPRVELNEWEYINQGKYQGGVVPTAVGWTELVVRVDGKEINGSPFSIYVQEETDTS